MERDREINKRWRMPGYITAYCLWYNIYLSGLPNKRQPASGGTLNHFTMRSILGPDHRVKRIRPPNSAPFFASTYRKIGTVVLRLLSFLPRGFSNGSRSSLSYLKTISCALISPRGTFRELSGSARWPLESRLRRQLRVQIGGTRPPGQTELWAAGHCPDESR